MSNQPEPPDYLFSVEADFNGEQVFMHLDKGGLNAFIKILTELRDHVNNDSCDHDHLCTPEWAGWELSPMPASLQNDGWTQVNHIKIYGWTDEWRRESAL